MSSENILGLDNKLVMKSKQVFLSLNTSFKLPLKIIYLVKKEKKHNLVEWGWTKKIAHYEYYGKIDHKNEQNIREYDISG